MPSSQCCWSLGCLLLLLGGNLGIVVEIHQDSVNGTVGQSVLLPVSYRFDGAPLFPVRIFWTFSNSLDKLITCTVLNCSLGARGTPSSCSANCFPEPTNHSRTELFPKNGSLLLRDLRLSDSGVYSVTFGPSSQTKNVSLALHEQPVTPQHPADTVEQDHIRYSVIGICSLISLLLLFLLFCCIRRQGAAEQQKRRSIKQHQVSSAEESHMDSTVGEPMTTIYARVGDSFEQPQPTPTPETVYASITSPCPPGLDTGPFHHLV